MLHLKSSKMGKPSATGMLRAEVVLECEISDQKVWEEVSKKFAEGLPVYADQDFHVEVLAAMQMEIDESERTATQAKQQLEQAVERKEHLEKVIAKMAPVMRALGMPAPQKGG